MKTLSIVLFSLATAGVAFAGDAKTDAKADPKAAPAKTDAKAAPAKADAKPAMPEMPKPPAEIADHAKQMAGTWRCTGTTTGMDGKSQIKMNGTMTSKLDLDGWYIHDSFVATMPEMKGMKFKMESYGTYDASGKKWRGFSVMNDGGMMQSTGDFSAGKGESTADTWGPMGAGMMKDHVDATDAKKGVHMWGEMSMDKGKNWMPVYDMTCKK